MDEPVTFQARADSLRLDIFLEIDPDVFALASLRRTQCVPGSTIRRVPAIRGNELGFAPGRGHRTPPLSSGRVGLEVTHDQAADVRRIHSRSRQEVCSLRHEQRSRAGWHWQAMRAADETGI